MVDTDAVRMDATERDEFLGSSGTGVLSLGTDTDDPPHSIPVSYGYDAREGVFYFRLAVGPDSEKGFLEGRAVSFVRYGRESDRWRSVVASGRLVSTTDPDVAIESLTGLAGVTIPIVDIFGEATREVDFEFYRLDPDRITGRVETASSP